MRVEGPFLGQLALNKLLSVLPVFPPVLVRTKGFLVLPSVSTKPTL